MILYMIYSKYRKYWLKEVVLFPSISIRQPRCFSKAGGGEDSRWIQTIPVTGGRSEHIVRRSIGKMLFVV